MAWIAPGRPESRWDEPPDRYGGLEIETSVWTRLRGSELREDGLEMRTGRRCIALHSGGPFVQLDCPLSDVAPSPAREAPRSAEPRTHAGVDPPRASDG